MQQQELNTIEHVENVEAKVLDPLVKVGFIEPEGKDWLVIATDPFHDSPPRLQGFPDSDISPSVVQCVKKSFTISKNGALPAGNWDCHLVNWPIAVSQQFTPYANIVGLEGSANYAPYTGSYATSIMGGLVSYSVAAGTNTVMTSAGTTTAYQNLDMGSYYKGNCRIIGLGFEVVNTTSELYKQGSVIVYRSPVPSPIESSGSVNVCWTGTPAAPGPIATSIGAQFLPTPPLSPADAMLLQGSRQWAAKDGCYCVSTMNGIENPVSNRRARSAAVYSGDYPGNSTVTFMENFSKITVNSNDYYVVYPTALLPFNISGAYFTGLSEQTTLTVNYVFYVERFPTKADTDLVVLASPSPGLDTEALKLYSEAMMKMPVGVPFGENPLGEWFEDVVNEVAGFAAPALGAASLVFPEFAPILGPLGVGVKALKEGVLEPRAQKRKQKRQKKKEKKELQKLAQGRQNKAG